MLLDGLFPTLEHVSLSKSSEGSMGFVVTQGALNFYSYAVDITASQPVSESVY
jgi:uncharacterized protein YigE (DUF2233 family)